MNDLPTDLIHQLRQLMPIDMLTLMGRPLSRTEARAVAEAQSTKLLRLLDARPPNAEVERLAELPDIDIRFTSGLPVSGYSAWNEDRWLVGINRSEDLWRCRATLCHELKHILDDPFTDLLYPRSTQRENRVPQAAEGLSNYFAGCTLVPREWLERAWRDGWHDVDELAAHFNVSRGLIRVRLRQVNPAKQRPKVYLPRYTRRLPGTGTAKPSVLPWGLPAHIQQRTNRAPCRQLLMAGCATN